MAHQPTHKTDSSSWLGKREAQLSVDVIESPTTITIRSVIAGVDSTNLHVHLTPDVLTIRGERQAPDTKPDELIHLSECYWGIFSRSIVLPHPINPDTASVAFTQGILTVHLKKTEMEKSFSGDQLTT